MIVRPQHGRHYILDLSWGSARRVSPPQALIFVEESPTALEALTDDEESRISQLPEDQIIEIDEALLSNTTERFRKSAMVIGLEMESRVADIPDFYYLTRLKKLVDKGLIESAGNIDHMRFSEVRRPSLDLKEVDNK